MPQYVLLHSNMAVMVISLFSARRWQASRSYLIVPDICRHMVWLAHNALTKLDANICTYRLKRNLQHNVIVVPTKSGILLPERLYHNHYMDLTLKNDFYYFQSNSVLLQYKISSKLIYEISFIHSIHLISHAILELSTEPHSAVKLQKR